jgi:hypothetical protein
MSFLLEKQFACINLYDYYMKGFWGIVWDRDLEFDGYG